MSAIASAQLVADAPAGGEPPELQEFYERMERARGAAVEAAVKKYRSLTPILCKVGGRGRLPAGWVRSRRRLWQAGCASLLVACAGPPAARLLAGARSYNAASCNGAPPLPLLQIEELVAGTNNGRSPQLASYFFYWEQAVFNALAVMLLRGLERLHTMLGPSARQPLFRVRTRGCCMGLQGCDAPGAWHAQAATPAWRHMRVSISKARPADALRRSRPPCRMPRWWCSHP